MNVTHCIQNMAERLNDVRLQPHFSAGISIRDKKSGFYAAPESVSIRFTATLLHTLLFLIGGILLFRILFLMMRARRERDLVKKWKRKWKMARKK